MAVLYRRVIEVKLGTKLITGLRMAFDIQRNLRREPNTAEIKIWNLSRDSRSALGENTVPVQIEAGYEEAIGQIFLGYMREPKTSRDGPDIITSLKAGDGEKEARSGRISKSFRGGTAFGDVLKTLAKSIGINADDAIRKLGSGDIRGGINEVLHGIVLHGNAWQQLDRLLLGSGLEASIQDGTLQILERGKPTAESAVLLSTSSGLVGAPEIGEKGKVKCKSLLQPRIYPGRKIKVKSEFIDGFYRAEVVNHKGDTWGQDWYTLIEGAPL